MSASNEVVLAPSPAQPGPWSEAWREYRRNRAAIAGLVVVVAIALMVLIGPHVYAVDPFDITGGPLTPPLDSVNPLGTDVLGRDILAGLLHGGRPTLIVGFVAALIAVLIGMTLGTLGGYFGGRVDELISRITEFFQTLPALLFAMVIVTLFGASLTTVTLAIGAVSWTPIARLTRAEFLRIKQFEYVRAARSIGATDMFIALRVIFPNAVPPILVAATLAVGTAVLFEAGLSFLGLTDANTMSWGLMIGAGRTVILQAWWPAALPGILIFLTVLGISLIGDGLNDALNPRLRSR
ncbi:MAG: ABC transporter permease [Betaproteobacteria bacterium]